MLIRHPLNRLHNEMANLFNAFEGREQEPARTRYPLINVWEEEDVLYLEAEVPGLELNDLNIFVNEGNHLTLQGERKERVLETGTWHRREQGFGKFNRELVLPFDVDAEKVEAKLSNGVLTIMLPKSEAIKPKRIEVKG